MMIIYDDHIWSTYMIIIYDDHQWSSSYMSSGVIWESSGSHLGDIWESPGRHLDVIWEPFGIHLGDIWESGGWRGIWRSDLIILDSLSNRMQKFLLNFNLTRGCWGYHWVCMHIYSNICWPAPRRHSNPVQGPFTNTVRTPIAKASLGKY